MLDASSMDQLVLHIAQCLVDSPEAVHVESVEDGDRTVIKLRVAPGDVGKIIGRQGRTAHSLRAILSAASRRAKRRFLLDILEEIENHDRNF